MSPIALSPPNARALDLLDQPRYADPAPAQLRPAKWTRAATGVRSPQCTGYRVSMIWSVNAEALITDDDDPFIEASFKALKYEAFPDHVSLDLAGSVVTSRCILDTLGLGQASAAVMFRESEMHASGPLVCAGSNARRVVSGGAAIECASSTPRPRAFALLGAAVETTRGPFRP